MPGPGRFGRVVVIALGRGRAARGGRGGARVSHPPGRRHPPLREPSCFFLCLPGINEVCVTSLSRDQPFFLFLLDLLSCLKNTRSRPHAVARWLRPSSFPSVWPAAPPAHRREVGSRLSRNLGHGHACNRTKSAGPPARAQGTGYARGLPSRAQRTRLGGGRTQSLLAPGNRTRTPRRVKGPYEALSSASEDVGVAPTLLAGCRWAGEQSRL